MKWRVRKITTIYLLLMFVFCTYAFAREPSSVADFLFEKAKEYYEQDDYEQALCEFKKVLMVDPEHVQALMYIQIIREELGLIPLQQEQQEAVLSEKMEAAGRESAMALALEQVEGRDVSEEAAAEPELEPTLEEKKTEIEKELPLAPELIVTQPEQIEEEPVLVRPREIPEETAEEVSEEVSCQPDRIEKTFSPFKKFDEFPEEVNENIAPVKISGEYMVSLGSSEGDVIWKEANADYNEANWRKINDDFGINTYDSRVYDRLRVNIDTDKEEGFNLHTNITIDPWSFIGKSSELTATSGDGDVVDLQLKYWSNTRSIINESVISRSSSGVADSFAIPETKVVDGKISAFTARGIEYDSGFDTLDIPEAEIHSEFYPIREFWVEYNNEDRFNFRFFPIAYQDQALLSDDPLQLSGHQIYWEESPWLDRWQPGILNARGEHFTKGEWEDDLSFFTRDSNMTRLTSLRGFSMKNLLGESVSIEATAASPKGLWQDYEGVDNIEGATRIKFIPRDELLLGLLYTFRYGLEAGSRDADNRVIGADISYAFTPDFQVKGEVAYSQDERDLTQQPYDTKKEGNAYKLEIKRGKLQEERPVKWDEEAMEELEEIEPFDWSMRFVWTHMDKGFYPALANYRLTRKDPFWGRHLHFKEPYNEYYGGLYQPSLSWNDIRAQRLGDSVDIDRDVLSLRLEKSFFDEELLTLFDSRNGHEASSGKYIETVSRAEVDWQTNEKLLIKFLAIYHDLPHTADGVDPIIYDVDANKFLLNNTIEDGKNPSLKTVSTGFQYDFFDCFCFDFIYEYTNDFTVGLDDYPRRLLSNPDFTTLTEEGLLWQESEPYLYDQYLFPTPPYPWFSIYKAGIGFEPLDELKLRLEFTKNEYKFASQIDDNINHIGFDADYDITDKLSAKLNYTYSQAYNVQHRSQGLDYKSYHNVFVNLDYKMEDKGVFSLQFGEGALLPYSAMFTTSPYPGFLPTLDTVHIVRAYFSRKF